MEIDTSKIEILIRENFTKVSNYLDKVSNDYKNSIIDPHTLEEIRKSLKVNNFKLRFTLQVHSKTSPILCS